MNADAPFRPGGNSQMLMASAVITSAAAILISGAPSGEITLMAWNPSSALDVYVGFGSTPQAAASSARFPSGSALGSGASTLPVPARVLTSYTVNGGMYAAAVCASATGSPVLTGNTPIMLIPGQGQ